MADRVYPEKNVKFASPPNGAYYNLKAERAAGPPVDAGYEERGDQRRGRTGNPCCRLLACLCSLLVAIIIALGIAALVFYLVVHPKAPKYNVQDVRLASFSVSPASSTDLSAGFLLNAVTTYEVEARNPNGKIGIYYDTINIDVLSEGVSIGAGSIPPFYQGHRNTTLIVRELRASNVPLKSAVGNALQSAQQSGRIPLYVEVDVRARVKVGSWTSPHFWVRVRCDVAVNPNVGSGSQVVSKKCKVKQ
ncbi:hypothetical protein R1sor_022828 [Riccia sorocarpa]|uniref:Late embryogenesis abundant protein LEA-2 subgroup domain-containing protein n=1 Tax=Riccia sorocarpa TaxID=122646 RepID=A0ABD3GN21_9MARC